jgi:predicted small integral membrane protein
MSGDFFAVGENFFNLWMTPMGEVALPNAFRMIGCVGLIAVFVGQSEQAPS